MAKDLMQSLSAENCRQQQLLIWPRGMNVSVFEQQHNWEAWLGLSGDFLFEQALQWVVFCHPEEQSTCRES